MVEISPAMVKELREKTGAGMMDCKKALDATGGNMEEAVDWLRKKGLASAAKKSGRVAAQGLVAALSDGTKGVVIEVNSETDFVSRNELFQNYVKSLVSTALASGGDFERTKKSKFPGDAGKTAEETLVDLVAKIGENMSFRRSQMVSVGSGAVSSYVHNAVADGIGKIGVLVGLESKAPADKLQALGKQLAMHVAAASPLFLSTDSVDAAALEREKNIFRDQAKASGKPDNIVEKMVDGRVRKYYEEVVLLEQAYVMDPDKKVKDVVASAAKDFGADVRLAGFARFLLGDGIEKKQEDFAAEVAAATKGA